MLFSTPSSFECLKGTSKGKKDDTTALVVKKRESEKLSKRDPLFVKP